MIKKSHKKKEKIQASLYLSLLLAAKEDEYFSITELSLKIIQKNRTRLLCLLPSLQNT